LKVSNLNERQGIVVVPRENEDIESLIKRFKKKVNHSGILRDVKIKSHYEKPSEFKKRKRNEARVRLIKEQLKLEKTKRRVKPNEGK
jgi:small subunit ribosomal protein S21